MFQRGAAKTRQLPSSIISTAKQGCLGHAMADSVAFAIKYVLVTRENLSFSPCQMVILKIILPITETGKF